MLILADNIGPPINRSGLFVNQTDLSMTVIQMKITADFMDNQQRKIWDVILHPCSEVNLHKQIHCQIMLFNFNPQATRATN